MALPNTDYAYLLEREMKSYVSNIISPCSVLIKSGFINRRNTSIFNDGKPTNTISVARPFDMETYTREYNNNRFGTTGETALLEGDTVPYTLSRAYSDMARIGLGVPDGLNNPKLYTMLFDHTHYLTPSGELPDAAKEVFATKFAQSASGELINSIDKNIFNRIFVANTVKEDFDNTTDVHGLSVPFASDVQPDYTWTTPIYTDLTDATLTASSTLAEIESLINVISSDSVGLNKENFNMQAYMIVPRFVFSAMKRLEYLTGNCNRFANDTISSKINYRTATDYMVMSDNVVVVGLDDSYFPDVGGLAQGLILFPDALKMGFQGLPIPTEMAMYTNSPVAQSIAKKMMQKIATEYMNPTDIMNTMDVSNNTPSPKGSYEALNWGQMVYKMLTLTRDNFADNRFVFTQNIFDFYGYEFKLRPDSLSQATVAKVECMYGVVRNRPKQIQPILFDPLLFGATPIAPAVSSTAGIPSEEIKYLADVLKEVSSKKTKAIKD